MFVDLMDRFTHEGDTTVAEGVLPAGLAVFDGHFPAQSILPGVVQLEWITRVYAHATGTPVYVRRMPALKFTRPIVPNDRVRLTLKAAPKDDEVALRFTYEILEADRTVVASQGRMVVCPL